MALGAVVFLMASSFGVVPAGAAASVVVTPSTGLVSGQTVTVSGAGFATSAGLASAECKAGAISIPDCDISTAQFPAANADGTYSFSFVVRRQISTQNGSVDCSASDGACVIGVADGTDIAGTGVTAPISFEPLPPPKQGVIHVPTAPVAADATIDITATKFAAESSVEFTVCAATVTSDPGDCHAAFAATADGTGAADGFIDIPRTLATLNGQSFDCAIDGNCVYAAWDLRDMASTLATAPVKMATTASGSVLVEPSTGLHDGDSITVSGTGWPAGLYVGASECDGTDGHANCSGFSFAQTAFDGSFSVLVTAQAVGDGGAVDCETGPCWMVVQWVLSGDYNSTAKAISFDTTPVPVTSHYSATELGAITDAATTLGVSTAEEQHLGSWGLAWVLLITGAGTITPVAETGPSSVTTNWLPAEYAAINTFATAHGATFPEFQKTGALLLAYVLALGS